MYTFSYVYTSPVYTSPYVYTSSFFSSSSMPSYPLMSSLLYIFGHFISTLLVRFVARRMMSRLLACVASFGSRMFCHVLLVDYRACIFPHSDEVIRSRNGVLKGRRQVPVEVIAELWVDIESVHQCVYRNVVGDTDFRDDGFVLLHEVIEAFSLGLGQVPQVGRGGPLRKAVERSWKLLIEFSDNRENQLRAGPLRLSTKSWQKSASFSSSEKFCSPHRYVNEFTWSVGSVLPTKDGRRNFSVVWSPTSLISREKGVLSVSARTHSICEAEVIMQWILEWIS